MPKKSIRFGVGNINSLHSATWSLGTDTSKVRSDVYLSCRGLGGELKASMHQSGNWHVAFSENTYKEKVEGEISNLSSRFTDKWTRPPEIAKGVTLAFRIVIPCWAVSDNSKVKNSDRIVWIPTPPIGKAIEIHIHITTPIATISEWSGKNSVGNELIGSIQLNNGETVWVVSKIIDCPDFSKVGKGTGGYFKGKSKNDIQDSKNTRGLLFGVNPDGSREIYDITVNINST